MLLLINPLSTYIPFGRTSDRDNIALLGWNAYMTPEQAARGLTLMSNYPTHADDIPNVNSYENEPYYPDLRDFDLFKDCETVE